MWRVPGERVALVLDGPTVEVERISSWAVHFECQTLSGRFMAAASPDAEYATLTALYDRFVREAQPSWDIVDHLGAVPNTPRGLARLPLGMALAIVSQWLDTLIVAESEEQPEEEQPASAVDVVVPPGPVNLEIKRRLRKAKAA